jgi:hypothetical protein
MQDPSELGLDGTAGQTPGGSAANAKLREERRNERAQKLGAELKLDEPTVGLLRTLNADEMEAKAKEIAAARGAAAPAAPAPTDPPTPAAAPTEGQQPPPAQTPPPVDPGVDAMAKGGDGAPAPVVSDSTADLNTRLSNAKSMEEIKAIQEEMKAKERERNRI